MEETLQEWNETSHSNDSDYVPMIDLCFPVEASSSTENKPAGNTRRILIIAGSDSSGGAGLEADQKVVAAHGCYAMTATTALTAQNTQGVFDIHHTPPEFVARQINLCIDDIGVDVVKIGMLASAATVTAVGQALRERKEQFALVLDPVMVSTSGAQLLPPDAVSILRETLLPMATILTPNIPEAKLLLGKKEEPNPQTYEQVVQLAADLQKLGSRYVLVKGGHFRTDVAARGQTKHRLIDVLHDGHQPLLIEKEFLKSRNTHGTGCSLASAIASNLALGHGVPEAVHRACRYVEAGIRFSIDRGHGSGPINHFHSLK
ncbi:hypothetical protein MMC10_007218 [Thelotrema lepadinum]|nr:hypothetical protein [Thelotrema lepadinum]